MNVVSYTRVSTEAQTEGLGLDVQDHAINEWAAANGHEVIAQFVDGGISGSNGLDQRAGLVDALAALREDAASGLVVYRLDRLARDVILQEQLLADIWRMGAAAYSTSESEGVYLRPDDPDDPSRKLIRQVLGAVADYERAMIGVRLRGGRRRKAAQGGFAYGSPPYGWRAEAGELVPIPKEQAALTLIRERRAAGDTLQEVATALETAGYPPKRGDGGRWHPEVVRRILARGENSHTG